MVASCLLNSVLHIVPQSLTLFNSFIHIFGWTSFPYPTALETSDATCPYSLECTLHGSVTWHRPLKSWLQILWAAGFPHRLLQGSRKPACLEGLLAWCWGGSKHFWGIAKFNFQRVAHLQIPVSIPKREIWYFPVTEIPWDHQCGESHLHFRHWNDFQHLSWEVWGRHMGCNAGTNITKNERTRNVSRVSKGTLGATPSLDKNHRIEASWD